VLGIEKVGVEGKNHWGWWY